MIEFIPNSTLSDAVAQATYDVGEWEILRASGDRQTRWADWAGDELDAMMRFPNRTLAHLGSVDSSLRLAAIALVVEYWPPREAFAAPCIKLAFDDPETPIRGAALRGLLNLQSHIRDRTGWLANLSRAVFGEVPDELKASAMRAVEDAKAAGEKFKRESLQKLAGAQMDHMLQSREAAESLLHSPDPQIRRAALFALRTYWACTKELADQCEAILSTDPDTTVRRGALGNIAGFYGGTDDPRIGTMFAHLAQDETQPMELRALAYHLLYSVRGMPFAIKKQAWRAPFPDEADWDFVNSFLAR